ncbi:hypothetical protein P4O66_009846 [Electrophorus voltai]|uniref:Alkylated DNA repair protein AlkB homologue 8 N-terminal domain-containing protein n=1 Tax=Electrophorus voltai TaxID=2609070 RepID=A0AAD8ZA06_9TELE|nr:hypothetical protein P4O66_009846 [Electrophorus voltai]
MDPLQFAYRHNRSTDDAIAHLLHTTLTHLDEGRGNYVKMLFVDYSSAFNTIIPSRIPTKLEDLGLHPPLCDWISNFLTAKDLIVDSSKKQEQHYQPVRIKRTTVERVDSFRYLGVHISQDLSWSHHTNSLEKKARQRLYHLRRLRDFGLPSKHQAGQAPLQRVVRSAEHITHTKLSDLQTIYYKRCQTKARRIVKDPTHPNYRLFSLLMSGKRFRSLKTKTERLKRIFFRQAIRAMDQGN